MNPWIQGLINALACVGLMLLNGSMIIYMLRKVLGHAHLRLGPTELGPGGIAQLIPDIVKLLVREDRHPNVSDKWLYCLAPILTFVPSLIAYAFLPFSDKLIAADVSLGVLMLLSFLSLVPVAIFAAGYASHSKYATIGAMRAIGGSISYEIPLILSAMTPVMLAGTLNLREIVLAQQASLWYWLPCLPSAVMFFICSLMETNQSPFDMSEAETELIAGFSTEYSAMRFGFMYLAEFSNNFIMAGMMVALFFGGWTLPFVPPQYLAPIAPVIFVFKTYLIIFCFMMVRGTYSRFRVDQMAGFGFKWLMPAALIWTMLTGFVVKLISMMNGGA